MNRPGYREAIRWLAEMDDNEWVAKRPDMPSVAACMVRDLWNVTERKLHADLARALAKIGGAE